jgi:RNA polymerase sigma factor for flagellar operon FliA
MNQRTNTAETATVRTNHPSAAEYAKALMPEVRRIARAMSCNRPRAISEEDLVGAGGVGLAAALSRGDLGDWQRFRAYALMHIRGAMIDELRRGDNLTRGQRKRVRELSEVMGEFPAAEPVTSVRLKLAKTTGLSEHQLSDTERLLNSSKVVSLDSLDTDRLPLGTPSRFPWRNADAVEAQLDAAGRWHTVRDGMDRLTVREREVIDLDLERGMSGGEIAAAMGVSESRVSQLRAAAVQRLRAHCAPGAFETDAQA